MRIAPITNPTNCKRPSFGYIDPLVKEAQYYLNHCNLVTAEMFQSGRIHKGLAKLDYLSAENRKKLADLYRHVISNLRLENYERRGDIAIREGVRNGNYPYLELLMDKMGVIPIAPDGEIPSDIIIEGKCHPDLQIRQLFDDEYLRRKTSVLGWAAWDENRSPFEIIEGRDIFAAMMSENNINRFDGVMKPKTIDKRPVIEFAKKIIEKDEENFGTAKIETIFKIVSQPEFEYIKDDSLNISGSKILHLLAEIYINPNNKTDMFYLKSIIKSCRLIGYDFDIKNDFGETALDKAREAECKPLIEALLPYRGTEYYD